MPDARADAQPSFDPDESSLVELHEALVDGRTTSTALVRHALGRIERIDRSGPRLNAMPILNADALAEAAESDERRQRGESRGVLDGIPFAVKDSYRVKGLTVAAGSPAFANLMANEDAFVVAQLRDAGAVLIGKTNMPPMADGGMQRGLYGRSESPYNPRFLAAAFGSGSSHGSAVAVAAGLCAFSLGGETVSSGRSPASNNGLVTYTPSRGVISVRGTWPLFPARDVLTPYTRTVRDLLPLLDVLLRSDHQTRGDLWRRQQEIPLPVPLVDAPECWSDLPDRPDALLGRRIAVPREYIEGSASIAVRPSIRARWDEAAARLASMGAELVLTEFPVIAAYEGRYPAGEDLQALGMLPEGWLDFEFNELLAFGWDDFLRENGDPCIPALAGVDPNLIFPTPDDALPDRYDEVADYGNRYRAMVELARSGIVDPIGNPLLARGLHALERMRVELFERWLDDNGFDLVAFPANADIGRADSDVDPESADAAWRNGVLFSNGNYAIRHLGIPTLTVPMGVCADIGMPVGLSFAGRAYSDRTLIEAGLAFESPGSLRVAPNRG